MVVEIAEKDIWFYSIKIDVLNLGRDACYFCIAYFADDFFKGINLAFSNLAFPVNLVADVVLI